MADATDSDGSESISTSSSSPESPARQLIKEEEMSAPTQQGEEYMAFPDNNDDQSDVSMSAETDDSENDDNEEAPQAQIISRPMAALFEPPPILASSRKRKLSSDPVEANRPAPVRSAKFEEQSRVKTDHSLQTYRDSEGHIPADRSLLPAEIWHHVFTFCPPKALERSLQVNKVFHSYLDASSSMKPPVLAPLSRSVSAVLQPDAIWAASRRLFRPGMPSPLQAMSELQMWRLVSRNWCEFCNRKGVAALLSTDPFHRGPGENGNVPIWLFGVRSCGPCLVNRSTKEIDLLLSSSIPSTLLVALPFVFVTNDFNIVSATTLSQGRQLFNVQIAKYFWSANVENLKQEFFRIKAMGYGTAEEWIKGLEARGKDIKADAQKWEKWELLGGLLRINEVKPSELGETIVKSSTPISGAHNHRNSVPITLPPNPLLNGSGMKIDTFPMNNYVPRSNAPMITSYAPAAQFQNGFAQFPPQRAFAGARQERSREEVLELKTARRIEIERRCLELDPPILPGVLAHMASFQAAVQIITPFDDNAWELLKPRLMSQRDEAEQREADRLSQARLAQEKLDERRQQEIQVKEVKDMEETEWEDAQTPVRNRIAGFADEIIRDGWANGNRVNKENCPNFAAEVLQYVRKRFYAEVFKDQAATQAVGLTPKIDPLQGPFTQKLTLENMKWIFDSKVKPITEPFRKELFICNGCENLKFYGFEGVIQHYAAKHTGALSLGSIVVHWRAEWPEEPPFHPDPLSGTSNVHSTPTTALSMISGPEYVPHIQSHNNYPPAPMTSSMDHSGQYTPAYQQITHSGAQYGNHYAGQQPYGMPPASQPSDPHSYFSQSSQGHEYNHPQMPAYEPQSYDNSYHGPQSVAYQPQYAEQPYQAHVSAPTSQSYPISQPPTQIHPVIPHQNTPQSAATSHPVATFRSEEYKAKLLDVARSARDTWNGTAGVKEMPGSARVYVILFHILKDYRALYSQDPSLTMIIDGLNTNKDMRPVRNINGLACRACILEKARKGNTLPKLPKGILPPDKKLHSLPQLLNHFQSVHVATTETPEYSWTEDMVELPEQKRLRPIAKAGTSEQKLKLITEALPDVLKETPPPTPEPVLEPYFAEDYPSPHAFVDGPKSAAQAFSEILPPSKDKHLSYYNAPAANNSDSEDKDDDSRYITHEQRPIVSHTKDVKHEDVWPPEEHYGRYGAAAPPSYGHRRLSPPQPPLQSEQIGRVRHLEYYSGYEPSVLAQPAIDRVGGPTQDRQPNQNATYREIDTSREESRVTSHHGNHGLAQEVHSYDQGSGALPLSALIQRASFASAPPARDRYVAHNLVPDEDLEDGEVHVPHRDSKATGSAAIASYVPEESAAERFLNDFMPGESAESYARKAAEAERRAEEALRARYEAERAGDVRRVALPYQDPAPRLRQPVQDEEYVPGMRLVEPERHPLPQPQQAYAPHEEIPRQHQIQRPVVYQYADDEYAPQEFRRQRAYRLPNGEIVYMEDRPGSPQILERRPRYETMRPDMNRARSRSPVYATDPYRQREYVPQQREYVVQPRSQVEQTRRVRTPGGHMEEYMERAPQYEEAEQERIPAHDMSYERPRRQDDNQNERAVHQNPVVYDRAPYFQQEIEYERGPPQGYYRVYTDEQPQRLPQYERQPQYEDQIRYVQVEDDRGGYIVQRPEERRETRYVTYEDERPQPVLYESRAQPVRAAPAQYDDEEYDPRNPAPPPLPVARGGRYQ